MARTKTRMPLRTKGQAWGPRRVELGVSLRDLSTRSGINRGDLSKIEAGRMVPTANEFQRVMAVLEEEAAAQGRTASGSVPDMVLSGS